MGYPQDVAVPRYLHAGSVRWGTAAAAAKHQASCRCVLCDVGHDSAQHLFFDCEATASHRAAWIEAHGLLAVAPPCLKFHALVPAGAPDTRAYKRALVSLQALQLQCLQDRRLAQEDWQRVQHLRVNSHLKRCPLLELLKIREAQRDPPPPFSPPPKPPPSSWGGGLLLLVLLALPACARCGGETQTGDYFWASDLKATAALRSLSSLFLLAFPGWGWLVSPFKTTLPQVTTRGR